MPSPGRAGAGATALKPGPVSTGRPRHGLRRRLKRQRRVGDRGLRAMQRAVVDLAIPRREQPKGRGDEKAEEDTAADDAVDRHRKQTPVAGDLGRARRPMAGGTVGPFYSRSPCKEVLTE